MRSDLSGLTGTEAILRVATARFADEGADRVTIRAIAADAGVSPALVIHHFGSRSGLRAAVEQRVLDRFTSLIADLEHVDPVAATEGMGSRIAEVAQNEPEVFGFFRRMLIEGGTAADTAFRTLFDTTVTAMAGLEQAGFAEPAADAKVRAAFLLANDLAVLLLRDRITAVIGSDPLTGDGMRRWSTQVMAAYTDGVFRTPGPTGPPGREDAT